MPRSIGTTFRASLEDPYNDDPPLVFLTFDHDDLDAPLRFVWDAYTHEGEAGQYVLDGQTYTCCPFELELLSDSEQAPTGRITVQNVDREIGDTVRALSTPPSVTLAIYPASDWDHTVHPRTPTGTPALAYQATNLTFRNITVDAVSVSGDLVSYDYVQEPWPMLRATPARLPGLWK